MTQVEMTHAETTQAERDALIDLYVDDALPESLRATVEIYLEAHPEAAAEAAALQATISRLKSAFSDRPDAWFTERALDRLLREHQEAQEVPLVPTTAQTGQGIRR